MGNNPQNDKHAEKDKVRERYKGIDVDKISVIPARRRANIFDDISQKRVAVYVRVSTDSLQQTSSFELQRNYYTDFVERHDGWNLVRIYADEGISGTSLNHRAEFQKMISDAMEGRIDLIVVKSVSRFSRNIVDCIEMIRKLAEHKPPIGVYFENEGAYTLDKEKEMNLNFVAAMAQEESHSKSTAMNSSIEMRFSHGIFLTPPLLGYDNDENGNLIINESEAGTVKLIFFMYLYGYRTEAIAETLTKLGKLTKLGNTVWSPSTVRNVLTNERHCGSIMARKTWTPNYLTHKAVRNRSDINGEYDRNQYYKENNHEAIVSRDDFIAVARMLANAKYGYKGFLPKLNVILGGILSGFVSVNPRWGAFSVADYQNASNSAVENNERQIPRQVNVRRGDFDFRGYEVARTQFFNSMTKTCVTLTRTCLWFSSSCVRKFSDTEHVEILVHPFLRLIVVRPCAEDFRNAVKWAKASDAATFSRYICGAAFLGTIFELFDWSADKRYRLRGEIMRLGDERIVVFSASEAEIISGREALFPELWDKNFGRAYYENRHFIDSNGKTCGNSVVAFNTAPELNPTTPEIISENIQNLLSEIQNMGV
ncbi:resolvase [Clostridia bacterium]|nr:resolvase [Clostridia bacterium]